MSSPSDTADDVGQNGWLGRRVVEFGRRVLATYPADLAVLSLFVLASAVAIELLPPESTLRFLIALPLIAVLPGYACVSMLFPGVPESDDARWSGLKRGLDGVERAALGFGLSLAIVPLVLVAVGTVLPLTLEVVLVALCVVTLTFAQLASLRRLRLPPEARYGFHPLVRARDAYDSAFADRGVAGQAAALVLVVGMIAGVGSVAVAVGTQPDANTFTEFYVGTTNDDGELVTGGYPETVVVGEPATLTFGVENHERTTQEYVVVVQLQRVDDGEVVSRDRLGTFDETVPAGDTWQRTHDVVPSQTGDDLRITYLLYRGEPPEVPTTENAYRHLHIWIDVTETA